MLPLEVLAAHRDDVFATKTVIGGVPWADASPAKRPTQSNDTDARIQYDHTGRGDESVLRLHKSHTQWRRHPS
jgi:hypothetical protein